MIEKIIKPQKDKDYIEEVKTKNNEEIKQLKKKDVPWGLAHYFIGGLIDVATIFLTFFLYYCEAPYMKKFVQWALSEISIIHLFAVFIGLVGIILGPIFLGKLINILMKKIRGLILRDTDQIIIKDTQEINLLNWKNDKLDEISKKVEWNFIRKVEKILDSGEKIEIIKIKEVDKTRHYLKFVADGKTNQLYINNDLISKIHNANNILDFSFIDDEVSKIEKRENIRRFVWLN